MRLIANDLSDVWNDGSIPTGDTIDKMDVPSPSGGYLLKALRTAVVALEFEVGQVASGVNGARDARGGNMSNQEIQAGTESSPEKPATATSQLLSNEDSPSFSTNGALNVDTTFSLQPPTQAPNVLKKRTRAKAVNCFMPKKRERKQIGSGDFHEYQRPNTAANTRTAFNQTRQLFSLQGPRGDRLLGSLSNQPRFSRGHSTKPRGTVPMSRESQVPAGEIMHAIPVVLMKPQTRQLTASSMINRLPAEGVTYATPAVLSNPQAELRPYAMTNRPRINKDFVIGYPRITHQMVMDRKSELETHHRSLSENQKIGHLRPSPFPYTTLSFEYVFGQGRGANLSSLH